MIFFITTDPMVYSFAYHKVWIPKYEKLYLEYCDLATFWKFSYICLDLVGEDFHVLNYHQFLHIDQHMENPGRKKK